MPNWCSNRIRIEKHPDNPPDILQKLQAGDDDILEFFIPKASTEDLMVYFANAQQPLSMTVDIQKRKVPTEDLITMVQLPQSTGVELIQWWTSKINDYENAQDWAKAFIAWRETNNLPDLQAALQNSRWGTAGIEQNSQEFKEFGDQWYEWTFCTAWEPCLPVIQKLSELLPGEIHCNYVERGNNFAGTASFLNGKTIQHTRHEPFDDIDLILAIQKKDLPAIYDLIDAYSENLPRDPEDDTEYTEAAHFLFESLEKDPDLLHALNNQAIITIAAYQMMHTQLSDTIREQLLSKMPNINLEPLQVFMETMMPDDFEVPDLAEMIYKNSQSQPRASKSIDLNNLEM